MTFTEAPCSASDRTHSHRLYPLFDLACDHAQIKQEYLMTSWACASSKGHFCPMLWTPAPLTSWHASVTGNQHAMSSRDLQYRYSHVPPAALDQLLQQLLGYRREAAGSPIFPGCTSLLDPGIHLHPTILSCGGRRGGVEQLLGPNLIW